MGTMIMNNIHIEQSDNQYRLYLPTGICIGHLMFPPNHQYLMDAKALEYITRAIAGRWDVYENKKRSK